MQQRTKRLTTLAMLSALAYIAMFMVRIPVVLFLKYEPKDVIITIGGFLYGPLAAFAMSVVVSFIEMITVSETGIIGAVMNIVASCSFACIAAFIYKRVHTIRGAAMGLIAACVSMTAVMLLWNYLIVPIYMGYPRQAVAELLLPVFLPFNLLKTSLNAAITMLLYKPVSMALHKIGTTAAPAGANETNTAKGKLNIGVMVASIFIIITCILLMLVFQGRI